MTLPMRTRTELGQLPYFSAIMPPADFLQVIENKIRKVGSPGKIRTCNPSVNSHGVKNHKSWFSRRLGLLETSIFSFKCSEVVPSYGSIVKRLHQSHSAERGRRLWLRG